jgi:hypothetical protein
MAPPLGPCRSGTLRAAWLCGKAPHYDAHSGYVPRGRWNRSQSRRYQWSRSLARQPRVISGRSVGSPRPDGSSRTCRPSLDFGDVRVVTQSGGPHRNGSFDHSAVLRR